MGRVSRRAKYLKEFKLEVIRRLGEPGVPVHVFGGLRSSDASLATAGCFGTWRQVLARQRLISVSRMGVRHAMKRKQFFLAVSLLVAGGGWTSGEAVAAAPSTRENLQRIAEAVGQRQFKIVDAGVTDPTYCARALDEIRNMRGVRPLEPSFVSDDADASELAEYRRCRPGPTSELGEDSSFYGPLDIGQGMYSIYRVPRKSGVMEFLYARVDERIAPSKESGYWLINRKECMVEDAAFVKDLAGQPGADTHAIYTAGEEVRVVDLFAPERQGLDQRGEMLFLQAKKLGLEGSRFSDVCFWSTLNQEP